MMPVRKNQNWLPSIFNDLFENDWMVRPSVNTPAVNVFETDKEYRLELAAPGMTKKDFNIRIDEDNNLVVAMEKEQKEEQKEEGRYLRREFSYSKCQQTLVLPENVDKEKISATVTDGILNISIPKMSEEEIKKTQRQIEIK